MAVLDRLKSYLGAKLAAYLEAPVGRYNWFATWPRAGLRDALRPGDVLLVDGNTRVAGAIKYLTHSTWSHAAFYAGPHDDGALIEADLRHGVHRAHLAQYEALNTRICRPAGLTDDEIGRVIAYMEAALGRSYDLRNVFDLARYLLPRPPVPRHLRRRMLALGSGDPTRAICSTLIAEAFQSVRYPILPIIEQGCPQECCDEILHIRHHSLFVPRDFDLSPYFQVVKPTIEQGFDPHALIWASDNAAETPGSGEEVLAALR